MPVPISNVTRRAVYAPSGGGGAGPYAFTFEILAATDIAVYKDDVLLTLTTHYTVTINANGTGSVTITAAGLALSPINPTQYAIVGNRTISRTTDFTTGGDFFANTLNDELDQQTIFNQQNAEGLQRAMQAPQTDPTSINMTLPRASVRAGKYMSFDENGNPIAAEGRVEVAGVYAIRNEIQTVAGISSQVVSVAGNATNINTVAGVNANVTTVAGIAPNVTTVAGISSNVTSVAGNSANINTVAGSIANVNNVGGSIASVNTVAGELGAGQDVTVVANDLSTFNRIGVVAGSIGNVNAVGSNIANVNAVNSNATNINTVAGQISPTNNISTVAGVAASVSTVAGISANVTTVAGISSNVSTVATNSANVTTVAGSIGSVNTVSGSIASVNTNATNIANINQNAANITAIQNASSNATAAAASATTATTQATNAAASAAAASAVVLGNEPVRPSVRPSLLLDFANTKQLDPRITFTRASEGRYYDGKTVAKAEENLLLRSQEFDNVAWNDKTNVTVTANATTAPDGTTTAEQIDFLGTTEGVIAQTIAAPVVGQTYVFSVWLRADSNQTVTLRFRSTVTQSASVTTAWQRFTFTRTVAAANETFIGIGGSDTTAKTIYAWGAQLEQRSSVTAYTATTTQAITNYIPALQTAAAGVARFEHNPVTGESLGLEIEEQRANLFTYSEDFSNAAWSKIRSSISSNVIVAPDGTLTGDKLVEDTTASNTHQVQQTIAATSGTAYTITAHIKGGERSWAAVRFASTNSVFADDYVYFNLTAGTVGTTDADITASITPVGNGWYRCRATRTALATANGVFAINVVTADNTITHTGDGYSGIYIWGAQLEAGAFATSYIPTVAAQVTRSADAASMTGTNFSSWYRADEGSFYVDIQKNVGLSASNNVVFDTTAGATFTNRIVINSDASNYSFFVRNSDGTQMSINSSSSVGDQKIALAYKYNDGAAVRNGSVVGTDTSLQLPAGIDRLAIGTSFTLAQAMNGTIKKLAYYPKRLTNAELQGITTV